MRASLTYRLGGHSSSDDPTKYRDEGEAKLWEGKDPLTRHRVWLEAKGLWSARIEDDWQGESGRTITDAIARVEAAGPVPVESLFDDVWREVPPLLEDQRRRLLDEEMV